MLNKILNKIFNEWYAGAGIAAFGISLILGMWGAATGGWQSKGIVALFLIPFVFQLWGLCVLSQRLKMANKERFSALIFYWFYLIVMTFCLFFYCGLWRCYLAWKEDYHWENKARWVTDYNLMLKASGWIFHSVETELEFISGLALVFVVILLYAVIRMMRAIIEGGRPVIKEPPTEFRGKEVWSLDCLKCGAAQEPFWALVFFFMVFLSVSYLFGFAYAFHDKSCPPDQPALYMKNLPQPGPLFHASDLRNPTAFAKSMKNPDSDDPGSTYISQYIKGRLLPETLDLLKDYTSGTPSSDLQSALVKELDREIKDADLYDKDRFSETKLDDETKRLAEQHPKEGEDLYRLNRSLLEKAYPKAIAKSSSKPCDFTFAKLSASLVTDEEPEQGPAKLTQKDIAKPTEKDIQANKSSLEELIVDVKGATKESRRARVVVSGYADDANAKAGAYKSNYELAEARALNTKATILHRLSSDGYDKWRNIEWEVLPVTGRRREVKQDSEKNKQDTPGSGSGVEQQCQQVLKESGQVSEIYIERVPEEPASLLVPYLEGEHANPLNLLDYIYFANYTITTTGYGDIIPRTEYAKFICSFANICEVFFLVVFFNALLSLKKDGDKPRLDEARKLRKLRKLRRLVRDWRRLLSATDDVSQPPSPNVSSPVIGERPDHPDR